MSDDVVTGITAPEDDGQTPLDPDEARGVLPDWIATRADLNLAEEENIAHGIAWSWMMLPRGMNSTPTRLMSERLGCTIG